MPGDTTPTDQLNEANDLPEFSPRQKNLVAELQKINPQLSGMYIGAKTALANTQNPERLRHAAVSIRQLIDDLPKLDPRVSSKEDVVGLGVKVREFNKSTEQITTIQISDDGTYSVENAQKVQTVLRAVVDLKEHWNTSSSKAADKQKALLDALDTARTNLPQGDQSELLKSWMDHDGYFNGVTHDLASATVEEFEARLSSFEALLIDLLIPSAAENLDEIDEFIAEIEQ